MLLSNRDSQYIKSGVIVTRWTLLVTRRTLWSDKVMILALLSKFVYTNRRNNTYPTQENSGLVAVAKWPISQLKTGAKSLLSTIYTVLAGVKTHNKLRLDI